MTLAEELFGPQAAEAPPEARRWAHYLERGIQPVCMFVRRRDGLSWGAAQLIISYPAAGPAVPPDPPVLWAADLDRWLIDHRVRAIDEPNEAERFGYGLTERFEPIERRCGSGYFNALLVKQLHEMGLADLPAVAEKLRSIREYQPGDSSAADYGTQIRRALSEAAKDLELLAYPRDKAIELLSNAIAYYLDDRFNLSTRKLLGFG